MMELDGLNSALKQLLYNLISLCDSQCNDCTITYDVVVCVSS